MCGRIRIGALISGQGSNLKAIIDACNNGHIAGGVAFVGSDNPEAQGLAWARDQGIPTFSVDYRRIVTRYRETSRPPSPPDDFDLEEIIDKQRLFPPEADPEKVNAFMVTRAIAERALLDAMAAQGFDLLVLAGFMRNLTPYFIDRLNPEPEKPRIMNIHPALLPAFPGADGYGDTFRYGCKVGGCTVHFIDYGEDSGPIIGQAAFPILPGERLETIRQKGLEHEWRLYPECIRLFAEDRLRVVERRFDLAGGRTVSRRIVEIIKKP